ncbi:hypothetical protein FOMPIDRAFT_1025310, partial [Fomitopsis schrenkii]
MVVSGGKIMPFTACYDTTTTLTQYPTMPEWPAVFVGQNDLVVAEAPRGMLFDGVYDGGEDNEVFKYRTIMWCNIRQYG